MNNEAKIEKLYEMMDKCRICPRKCGANRNAGEKGLCNADGRLLVASCNVHMGEEPPITGINGSGTIFFANCSLKCVFCQNYSISQMGNGREITVAELSDIMIALQKKKAHNINLVTPTHYSAQVAQAVYLARNKGLKIPVVFNCGGYERVEVLKLLEDTVDIYLPDIKYADNEISYKYSGISDYAEVNRAALMEMTRQKGFLKTGRSGLAEKGVLVRHMVLPGNIENTKKCLDFIAEKLSSEMSLSLMAQYHPAYRFNGFPELARGITREEYEEALEHLERLNLENGWQQEL